MSRRVSSNPGLTRRALLRSSGATAGTAVLFRGATFSPSGRQLFVSIQTPGITFAIEGPWHRGSL